MNPEDALNNQLTKPLQTNTHKIKAFQTKTVIPSLHDEPKMLQP